MPLYSVCSGQISPKGEVLAFGVVNKDTISRAVRFDESESRFQTLSTVLNKENDSKRKMEELESKRASLVEFSVHPRPQEDQV